MDADVVHQRDITTILSQLEEDVISTQKLLKRHPEKKDEVVTDLNKLISLADRDLRLKTQAIVRNRLAHSSTLPFQCVPVNTPPTIPQPLPPKLNLPPLVVKNTMVNRNVATAITPIRTASRKGRTSVSTPSSKFKRQIRTAPPPVLPHYNRHDPFEPKPQLQDEIIKTFGLQRLTESRLVAESSLKPLLDNIIQVDQLDHEPPIPHDACEQRFILDEHKVVKNTLEPIIPNEPSQNEVVAEPKEEKKEEKKYIVPLHNGRPVPNSIEFLLFKREYSNMWEKVDIILNLLYTVCEDYGLKNASVDGQLVVDLTNVDPDTITPEKLIKCFIERRRILMMKKVTKVGFGFIGPHAEDKAATVIQSIFRGYHARRLVRVIRRNTAAARIIQRWFRNTSNLVKFRNNTKAEKKRRIMVFEANQTNPQSWSLDQPHIYIHLVKGHFGAEIGRVSLLSNDLASMIFFCRYPVPVSVIEPLRQIYNSDRLQFIYSDLKLPKKLPIEDVLASDTRSLARIKKLCINQVPIIQPSDCRESLIEISIKLNGYVLMPLMTRIMMFHTHEAVRRLLIASNVKVFESSDEVFDRNSLCSALTGLSVSHLNIQQWRIRVSNGIIGWVNTCDFVLLERLKTHSECLDEKDLEDENFRELLTQSLTNDLNIIVETTGTTPKIDFLREVWMNGASIEAAPRQVKSAPCVAFEIPPIGGPRIIGSWETIFISLYEPFASIHPAFTVDRNKLKKKSLKIANECSSKRLIGTNIIKYWYSTRTLHNSLDEQIIKLTLSADDLDIANYTEFLPQLTAEHILNSKFDEESMSMGAGVYTYVQRELVLPYVMEIGELKTKCLSLAIPIDTKVYFLPDLQRNDVVSLVCVEQTPELLVSLVYRVVCTLADTIFNLSLDSKVSTKILSYCHAIEYLSLQLDNSSELSSLCLMSKVKMRDINHSSQRRFFRFNQKDNQKEPSEELETINSERNEIVEKEIKSAAITPKREKQAE